MFSIKRTLELAGTDGSSPPGAPNPHERAERAVKEPRGASARLVSFDAGDVIGWDAGQARLAHAQRLESLGVLASGIVHEFRNLLAVIGANAAVAETSTDPKVQEAAQDIRETARRGRAVTEQLLAFARNEVGRRQEVELVRAVRGTVRLLEHLLGGAYELRVAAEGSIAVMADPIEIGQAVLNLVTNARDSMPAGGMISIRVQRLSSSEARDLGSRLDEPVQSVLEVMDAGGGMAQETLDRIFEPFFTTKPPGQGTGLGLAAVLYVVAKAGGSISVDSSLGGGSRFRLFFPVPAAPEA